MSSKGKPLNPQSRLNPPMQRGPLQVGQTGVWDGQTWVPETITATVAAATGTGTVTSIDLAMPKEFSVSGNPVTTTGTLTTTWTVEGVNTIFAGPSSGASAVPGFRVLVAADLPHIVTATDVVVDDATKGLVLKDTQGTPHYWRVSVSALGVLTTTDIGTTAP